MTLASSEVALTTCSSYAPSLLIDAMSKVLSALDLSLTLCSANVLLKPNLISAKHGRLACTEGAFILAIARWLLDHGAKVSVGDSPAFGSAKDVLQSLGISDELATLGVEIKEFSKGQKVKLPRGYKAVLAREALDCDLLVNLPRVKAHA
ncbi:MAG: DUF362 domain-containing protein, partial [Candidatus Electrothrix sp. AR3]|nr:DUF362 domain-containing protein [Candidatus Electrothrix sp. AR3]